jgi:hypothetical protein
MYRHFEAYALKNRTEGVGNPPMRYKAGSYDERREASIDPNLNCVKEACSTDRNAAASNIFTANAGAFQTSLMSQTDGTRGSSGNILYCKFRDLPAILEHLQRPVGFESTLRLGCSREKGCEISPRSKGSVALSYASHMTPRPTIAHLPAPFTSLMTLSRKTTLRNEVEEFRSW